MKIEFKHISVLTEEVLGFAPQASQTILDCTLGGGGHSRRLLEKFPEANLYGIDRDAKALNAAADCLKNYKEQIYLEQASFSELPVCFEHWGEPHFDYILADIGLSSEQLARPERGFSFMYEGHWICVWIRIVKTSLQQICLIIQVNMNCLKYYVIMVRNALPVK